MPMEKLPEKLCSLHDLYKESIKYYVERGFSTEEVFWTQFSQICPSIVWDENAPTEVKLSEVLRFYLSIYCEQVNPQMTVEEEPAFLELLRERYNKVNWIIFESHQDNYGLATLELGRLILGEGANLMRQIKIGMDVLSIACAGGIPLKLVRDI